MNYSFKNAWRILPLAFLCIFFFCIFPAHVVALSDDECVFYDSPIKDECPEGGCRSLKSTKYNIYCEIMPLFYDEENNRQVTESYNTFGVDICTKDLWEEALSEEAEEKFLDIYSDKGATRVVLNGPRLWVVDEIDTLYNEVPECASETYGKKVFSYVNGLQAGLGGQIEYGPDDTDIFIENEEPYSEYTVQRWTRWTYKAGTMVHELTNTNCDCKPEEPDVYIMQAIDPTQMIWTDGLPDPLQYNLLHLGERLDLPDDNWEYGSRILEEDYCLEAYGDALVIHDNLGSGYQKRTNLGREACSKKRI